MKTSTPSQPGLLVFLAAVTCLFIPAIAAADIPSFTQAGVTGTGAGNDETGALAAASTSISATVDPSTGIAHTTLPLGLPKARGGVQPRVSIDYSSAAGQGAAGWGWDLNVPTIERSNLSGHATYNDTASAKGPSQDRFAFNGSSLVPICAVPGCIPRRSRRS